MTTLFFFQLRHMFTDKYVTLSCKETSTVDKNKMLVSNYRAVISCNFLQNLLRQPLLSFGHFISLLYIRGTGFIEKFDVASRRVQ